MTLHISQQDRDMIGKLYGSGYTAKAIAERYGLTERKVRDIARGNGVRKRRPAANRNGAGAVATCCGVK